MPNGELKIEFKQYINGRQVGWDGFDSTRLVPNHTSADWLDRLWYCRNFLDIGISIQKKRVSSKNR
jgi:hypothetical protein